MPFYVYKITNTKTTKLYIGKTGGESAADRWYNHGKFPYYESTKNDCPKLYNSIRKYGIKAFTFEVLYTFEDEQEAYDMEERIVEEWNTIKNGYNCKPGGKGGWSGPLS